MTSPDSKLSPTALAEAEPALMRVERPRRAHAWLASLAASASFAAAATWLAPYAPCGPIGAYVAAFFAVCASALAVAFAAPLWTWLESFAAFVIAAIWVSATPLTEPNALTTASLTFGLLLGASALGSALGARIDRPGHLAAVALVSAFADVWSVVDPAAPSARLAASIEAAGPGSLSHWVVPWPMLGTLRVEPILGVGDVVFMALYAAAARAHALDRARMLTALSLACGAALAMLLALSRPLPLLPAFAVAVMALEPAARRLERREWRLVALFALCAALALWVRCCLT